ncbi:Ig-like domain-containing protein, partial [Capnocytophaga ochracea]|uniref:Ig-like domain-containing protein n=1 Tax=Capnocytophaga ochracea TaxID=1018 RepID=UPI003977CF02
MIVTPSANPPVNAGNDTTICPGHSVNLTATTTGTVSSYSWSDGTNTHSGATWNVSPASTTIYTVTAYYSNGCQKTDQVVINIDAPANVSA